VATHLTTKNSIDRSQIPNTDPPGATPCSGSHRREGGRGDQQQREGKRFGRSSRARTAVAPWCAGAGVVTLAIHGGNRLHETEEREWEKGGNEWRVEGTMRMLMGSLCLRGGGGLLSPTLRMADT
jgi:hypothetical protein